jgi:hypothetical protein
MYSLYSGCTFPEALEGINGKCGSSVFKILKQWLFFLRDKIFMSYHRLRFSWSEIFFVLRRDVAAGASKL